MGNRIDSGWRGVRFYDGGYNLNGEKKVPSSSSPTKVRLSHVVGYCDIPTASILDGGHYVWFMPYSEEITLILYLLVGLDV